MDKYTLVPKEYINKYKNKTETDPDFVFFDKNEKEVAEFEPHITKAIKHSYSNDYTYSPGDHLYIKNDDYNKLVEYIEKYKMKMIKKKEDDDNNILLHNNELIEEVQKYITDIINESNLLSQNDKTNFVEKIQSIVPTIRSNAKLKKHKIFKTIFNRLNTEIGKSLLFGTSNLTSAQDIDNFENNSEININIVSYNNLDRSQINNLIINVQNIVFLYDSETNTISLSKIKIGKKHTITSESDTQFTIDTTPPITIPFVQNSVENLQKAIFIYKVEGNTELLDLIQDTPNLHTSDTPMTLTKCIGDACQKTFRRITGQPARVYPRGGKRTRKQKYSARLRGIITLRNASAFCKQKKRGPKCPKGPKSRRKIERLTSFRNKR